MSIIHVLSIIPKVLLLLLWSVLCTFNPNRRSGCVASQSTSLRHRYPRKDQIQGWLNLHQPFVKLIGYLGKWDVEGREESELLRHGCGKRCFPLQLLNNFPRLRTHRAGHMLWHSVSWACHDIRTSRYVLCCWAGFGIWAWMWHTGCHVLVYPGAFNMTTGPLHWELLQRGRYESRNILWNMSQINAFRAVDNQVYVSMCSPARDMNAGYHAVSIPVFQFLKMWHLKIA